MPTNKQVKYKNGFTLAEILITLSIIGVVAALTIPGLIQSTQNSQYEAALKKNYSILAQAYKSLDGDGINMAAAFPGADFGESALNMIAPKLNIIKNCGKNMGCLYNTSLKYSNGVNRNASYDTNVNNMYGKAILADGTMVLFYDFRANCTGTVGTGPLAGEVCAEIDIDINGAKGPNIVGRDFFSFWATKTGLYPMGSNGDANVGFCGTGFNGTGCAARVLSQGMNY